MPANKAATLYDLPKSTLKDWLSHSVLHGYNSGPHTDWTLMRRLTTFWCYVASIALARQDESNEHGGKVALDRKLEQEGEISHGYWWSFHRQKNGSITL